MLQSTNSYWIYWITVDEGKEAGLSSEDTSVLVAVQQILQVPAELGEPLTRGVASLIAVSRWIRGAAHMWCSFSGSCDVVSLVQAGHCLGQGVVIWLTGFRVLCRFFDPGCARLPKLSGVPCSCVCPKANYLFGKAPSRHLLCSPRPTPRRRR